MILIYPQTLQLLSLKVLSPYYISFNVLFALLIITPFVRYACHIFVVVYQEFLHLSLVKINNLLKKHPRLTRTANSKFFIFSN
jgi:hypothetical protein